MNRALVTGADGFIGSHLVEELLQRGYFVTAIVQYNSFNSWGWLDHIENEKMLNIISGDIRDPHFCMNIIKDIDVIFHLAALIAIPYSYLAPDSYLDTNIKGTLNICQAAKQNGNIKVIHTSTSEVYGTALYVPIDEKHPKQPQSPYCASKIAADMIALSFYNSFGLPVVVARPFNTYGPRQSARAIIPTIITQIASGKKEIKVGDLSPTRDFNYVKDTVYGFIAIAESGDKSIGKEINISSNSEISMEDTFYLIKKIMKSEVIFVQDDQRLRPAKSEVFRLWGDNKLITDLTNYRQLFDIEKGLTKTIEWYMDKSNLSKFKTNMYNV
jgi:NAD dependent epimerase/dehydratase